MINGNAPGVLLKNAVTMNFVYKWVGCKLLIVTGGLFSNSTLHEKQLRFFFKIKVCVAGSKHAKKIKCTTEKA